ncbi:hypothetical protein [Streptomyces sp. NRRL F-2580]|uniref:hypothetical protein n=1 Tax=Streptomyces sp. NRRL F-2580 TaxID=1463841 RepID=UPI0018FEDDF6|nr:hypothetical protein [Streptomyces sp. NRRL F-2580]
MRRRRAAGAAGLRRAAPLPPPRAGLAADRQLLGRIRLRGGDLSGAEEALLAAHRLGWDPEPGLSLVRPAADDIDTAAASIREALARPLPVPSKELPPTTGLRRAPLLDAQVRIALARGDVETARDAARELPTASTARSAREATARTSATRAFSPPGPSDQGRNPAPKPA